jgi:MFS family permease
VKRPGWQAALSAQAALTQACWVGIRLMTGYRALERGADSFALGVIAASFALPALVTSMPLGRVADRWGGARLSFVGIGVAFGGAMGVLLMPGLWWLTASSALVGLGHIGIMIGQQTLVAAKSRDGSADAAFGNLTAAASVGQLIGPPVVTTAAAWGLWSTTSPSPDTTAGIIASSAFLILALPMFILLHRLVVHRAPPSPSAERPRLMRTPGLWRSLVVSGAVLVTVDLLYAFIPAWAVDQGISVRTVGMLLAVRATVSVVTRIGLSRLVSTFGRRTLITVSVLAAAAALVALPFVGTYGALVAMIGLGLGLGIPQPLTMSWVVRITDPAQHGAVLGLRMSSNRLAQITLPVAVGAVAAPFGASGVFIANAALLVVALFSLPKTGLDDPVDP